MTPVQKNKEAA